MKHNILNIIDKGIEKYPKVATTIGTITIISLAISGYTFGKTKKPAIAIGNAGIEKNIDKVSNNEITYQELNDIYLAGFHNEVTNTDNYRFVKTENNFVYDLLNNKKLFDLENQENKIISYEKLGSIHEYLITYNFIKDYYLKEEIEKLLKNIVLDIKNNKKLVK